MKFEIVRADGRSNAQVLLDYVRGGAPSQVYAYGELVAALEIGTQRKYDQRDVSSVVRLALPRLLREQQRTLHSVRAIGYRLAEAKEHARLSLERKRRADHQMRIGLLMLENVRLDELDANARLAHEGTLMVMGALWANQAALDKRLRAVEDAIATMK